MLIELNRLYGYVYARLMYFINGNIYISYLFYGKCNLYGMRMMKLNDGMSIYEFIESFQCRISQKTLIDRKSV